MLKPFLLLTFCLAGASAHAEQTTALNPDAMELAPEAVEPEADEILEAVLEPVGTLKFDRESIDLGEIQQGSSVELRFPYGVRGTGAVKILGIHQDCGCLITMTKPGDLFDANKTGELSLTLDTKAFAGPIDKSILLLTNENRKQRLHRLRIKARVRKMVELQPPLVRLDWQKGSPPTESRVHIRQLAQQTLHIESLSYNKDNLEVEALPVGDQWQLSIRWKGGVPQQPFQDMIRISAAPPYGEMQVPVLGNVPVSDP